MDRIPARRNDLVENSSARTGIAADCAEDHIVRNSLASSGGSPEQEDVLAKLPNSVAYLIFCTFGGIFKMNFLFTIIIQY